MSDQSVADAVRGNWVDRVAPRWFRPYARLCRLDRPIGWWLLLWPCWWSAALAAVAAGKIGPNLWHLALFLIGAIAMRGAGCTWNDITDRDFDARVARTRSRPIPSGQVTVRQAAVWMCLQALVAFAILLTFDRAAIWLGIASLLPVCVYPFAKRFIWWPQVFLGIAFNWGALLAWAAHRGELGLAAVILYLSGIAWTLFYDTIYAHQDTDDDALIGVKSTARLFGDATPVWLVRFRWASVALMAIAVALAFGPEGRLLPMLVAMTGPVGLWLHLGWQMRRLDTGDSTVCLALFRANRDAGLLPALSFAAALLV